MWKIVWTNRATRAVEKLPSRVRDAAWLLVAGLERNGPVAGSWPNYGKLRRDTHHCHLKKGRPTYVAVWREDGEAHVIEVTYVGTHENAPC